MKAQAAVGLHLLVWIWCWAVATSAPHHELSPLGRRALFENGGRDDASIGIGEGESTALVQDMLERAVELCTGDWLEEWQKPVLRKALQGGGARQRTAPGADGNSTAIALEISGGALRVLEDVLGRPRAQDLRPCLAKQMVGVTPRMAAPKKQLIFNLLASAVVDCGKPRLSEEAAASVWDALDTIYATAESAVTGDEKLKIRLEVDVAMLEVVEQAANRESSREAAEAFRWCMQSQVMGEPRREGTPPIAWHLLVDAARLACTRTPLDIFGETVALLTEGESELIGFAEYDDGVGGSTGEGRVRFRARVPMSFLRDKFVPALIRDGVDARLSEEELLECLLTVFEDGSINAAEGAAVLMESAHQECMDADGGREITNREFGALVKAMSSKNARVGSRILAPEEPFVPVMAQSASPRRSLKAKHDDIVEYWFELDTDFVRDGVAVLWADDLEKGLETLPCYKTFVEGKLPGMLSRLEESMLDLAVPFCFPATKNVLAVEQALNEFWWERNTYVNGTVIVTSFVLQNKILGGFEGHEAGSVAEGAVVGCIDSLLQGHFRQTGVVSSAAAQTMFVYMSSVCAERTLSGKDWNAATAALKPFLPEEKLSVSAYIDGRPVQLEADPAGAEPLPWWEADNITITVGLPHEAVSEVADVLGWEAVSNASECLEAIARLAAPLPTPVARPPEDVPDPLRMRMPMTAAIVASVLVAVAVAAAFTKLLVGLHARKCQTAAAAEADAEEEGRRRSAALLRGGGRPGHTAFRELAGIVAALATALAAKTPRSSSWLSSGQGGAGWTLLSPAAALVALVSYVVQLLRFRLGAAFQVLQLGKRRAPSRDRQERPRARSKEAAVRPKEDNRSIAAGDCQIPSWQWWTDAPALLPPGLRIGFEAELRPHMQRKLGAGPHGAVFRGMLRGRPVAVKVLRPEALNKSIAQGIQAVCTHCGHPNVVQALGASLERPNVAVAYELMTLDLHRRIHHPLQPPLSPLESMRIIRGLVFGLAALHPEVVHGNLKPQNILLDPDGNAKLTDFGFSQGEMVNPSASIQFYGGAPLYMAPEAFVGGNPLTTKGDIYALGIIMNECLAQKHPYQDQGIELNFEVNHHVSTLRKRPGLAEECPAEMQELIKRCWSHDPDARPDILEVQEVLQTLQTAHFEVPATDDRN